ncbi:MAG: hypothetical protein V4568_03670 [Pseudomonadota bacterium]
MGSDSQSSYSDFVLIVMMSIFDQKILPAVFMNSLEFKELTQKQVFNLEARFRYVGEIVENVESWLLNDGNDFKGFLDSLELDLSVNQNLPDESEDRETSHLIHSSWTFDTTVAQLRHALSPSIIAWLDQNLPRVDCSLTEFNAWLAIQCKALREVVTEFYGAQSFSSTIAHYIAMDILLANMLAGVYKARLNADLLQQA